MTACGTRRPGIFAPRSGATAAIRTHGLDPPTCATGNGPGGSVRQAWAGSCSGLAVGPGDHNHAAMRLQVIRAFAHSLPHTTVVKQWGECLVFKVAGKMFLLLALESETLDGVVFKCTPDEFDALTEIEGIAQAPYCAKRHWVRVSDLLALPPAELERRIRRSYDLVVAKLPKKVQAALAAGSTPQDNTRASSS